jgi:hypothetical protein
MPATTQAKHSEQFSSKKVSSSLLPHFFLLPLQKLKGDWKSLFSQPTVDRSAERKEDGTDVFGLYGPPGSSFPDPALRNTLCHALVERSFQS